MSDKCEWAYQGTEEKNHEPFFWVECIKERSGRFLVKLFEYCPHCGKKIEEVW